MAKTKKSPFLKELEKKWKKEELERKKNWQKFRRDSGLSKVLPR
jgi:hypothetical protein